MISISASVGYKGINRRDDVRAVQGLINAHIKEIAPVAPLVVDGLNGKNTMNAIAAYQRKVLGVPIPDSRVDVNGRTLKALNGPVAAGAGAGAAAGGGFNGFSSPAGAWTYENGYTPGEMPTDAATPKITYFHTLEAWRLIVHPYTFAVLEMIMKNAGVSAAVISYRLLLL